MRIFIFKRNSLIYILSGILIFVMMATLSIGAIYTKVSAAGQKKVLPIYSVDRSDKVISFSFDAAWGNEDTEKLIDIFNKYKIKTTFFVVGEWVDKYPESVKALKDAGHEVMSHSNTHAHFPKLTKDQMIEDVNLSNSKIEKITGVRPILFRPPYGDYNSDVIKNLASVSMYTIQWDVDSLDWKDLTADRIYDRVISKVKSGSIVLFHNAALHTPEALPKIIEKLQSDGYKIVPISQLIYKEDYKMDHKGKQIKLTEEEKKAGNNDTIIPTKNATTKKEES